jgi:hypothetical protein
MEYGHVVCSYSHLQSLETRPATRRDDLAARSIRITGPRPQAGPNRGERCCQTQTLADVTFWKVR